MTIPDDAFRHVPTLKGKIVMPDASNVRVTRARIEEFDRLRGGTDWRPSHEEREANRLKTLEGRLDRDLWVFGYGSLIWDPALWFAEIRRATLEGWHRSFCMEIIGGRGSAEFPGLMAALEEGGRTEGLVYRIAAGNVPRESEFLWMREMIAGTYVPRFFPIQTDQGEVEGLAFVMNTACEQYRPGVPPGRAAEVISRAEGILGKNFDYLDNLVRHLADLGIDDPAMTDLHRRASALKASAA